MRFLMGVAFLFSACTPPLPPVAVSKRKIDPASGPQCGEQCTQVGMTLDSVVIIDGSIGCVCRAANAPAAPASAAAVGVGAVVQMHAATAAYEQQYQTPQPTMWTPPAQPSEN